MVVVLVEFTNAQTPIAQAAWMVVVEVTEAFMDYIIAEGFQLLPNIPASYLSKIRFGFLPK